MSYETLRVETTGGVATITFNRPEHFNTLSLPLRAEFGRAIDATHFVATAEIMRLGGRVASTQMRLVGDDEALISTGTACYIVS